MPELVTIPIALFEVLIEYTRPNMRLLVDRANVVDNLFEAFTAWKIRIDDVEVINEGKPSDQGIKFKLPTKRTSFLFGAGSCKLSRDGADWDSAQETIKILDAGWHVLAQLGGVEASTFKTTIAMHLQPKTARFVDILKPFAPTQLLGLNSSPVKAIAAVVKWEKQRITLDGSSQLANGIFARLEREFEGSATYSQIAAQLKADEDELLRLLNVEEDRS